MDILYHMTLQSQNGDNWNPKFGTSEKYKNWIAIIDLKTCVDCKRYHGKIWLIDEEAEKEPPLHPRCRCDIIKMTTIEAGTATIKRKSGADWYLKYYARLPEYYLSRKEAEKRGYIPELGNLDSSCPDKIIFGGEYKNFNRHLPAKIGRTWYEADINYRGGYRNTQRILFSNDGLIFVTFDHYETYFEII